jgi:hypothetical protein
MRCWNAVVQKYSRYSKEFNVAGLCRQMLQQFGPKMPENIWTGHLLNLWEVRQICRADMLILMREYHEQNAAQLTLSGLAETQK